MFLIFVTWLFLAAVVGVFASQRRNRSGFGWFVLALLISPVLAFLLAAALRSKEQRTEPGYDWRVPAHAQPRPPTDKEYWEGEAERAKAASV